MAKKTRQPEKAHPQARKGEPAEEAQPLLLAAFFCEKVLHEAVSGENVVPSIIRIVDLVNVPLAHSAIQPGTFFAIPLNFFVMFKAGDARGERELQVRQVNPSGQTAATTKWKIGFQDYPEGGSIIHADHVPIKWDKQGTYWFELLLGDRLLTRVPLIVNMPQSDSSVQTPTT